ncbi:MAG TPA: head-tail adaptor protein, partial [Candidatus Paceibacterota bacterium]|nr:head-tail adaptor protein [Candidatus Paceibacterota bacterium]
MRLGRLDRRIEIQQPVLAVNDYGERDKTYTVFHSCWAKVTERYGDEKDLSEVDYPVLRVSFFIRHKAGVLQQFRVLHEGFLYEILEVKEVTYSRNRYLELITERRGNQTGTATGAPVASDATYENSDGSFSQAIPSGDTYFAPDITITDVDATTRDVPANTDVTCEWKTITVDNTDGVEKVSQATYPSGGAIELPDLNLRDTGVFNTDYPVPAEILISGRPVLSATYLSIGGNDLLAVNVQACPTVFPISIENGNGGVLGTISSDPDGTFDLGQISISNNTTSLGNFNRVTSNIRVATASYDTIPGTVTVEQDNVSTIIRVPEYPTAASGICYKNIVPVSIEYSARTGDCADRFQDGEYDATPPARPESFAEIDYAATQADVRGTPATGTSSTDLVSPTILKENNAFGNKF